MLVVEDKFKVKREKIEKKKCKLCCDWFETQVLCTLEE